VKHRLILAYFVLIPFFLLISIALTFTNTISACLFDFWVGWIYPGTFGAAFTSRCSGHSRSSMPMSCSLLDPTSAAIVFTVVWIIQATIPVKPIFRVWKEFKCATLITFDWMTVDVSDSADMKYLSSSSSEVLCRNSRWQRWSFWKFKWSHTIMWKQWPGYSDDLFRVRNESYSCHLLILSMRLFLCST